MTAEEMFEELGYKKITEENLISYIQYDRCSGYTQSVYFKLDNHTVSYEFRNDYGYATDHDIDCEEVLPVIIKQAKELGWYKIPKDEIKDYYKNKDKLELEEKKLELEQRKIITFEKITEYLDKFIKVFENK